MLNFDDEIVHFTLKGIEHSVSKPTNKHIKDYSKALDACENDESKEEALINLLEKLGLSKDVYEQLTPSQLKVLLRNLHDFEKN